MKNLIGRDIFIKRGKLQEKMIISEVSNITNSIFSVSGKNEKRGITVTMMLDEINESLVGGVK